MPPHACPEDLLADVPAMDIPFDGDCLQAIGINLPVLAINLPHRTDRWDTLRHRMSSVGLNKITRVPAVVGAALDDAQVAAILARNVQDIDLAPRSHLSLTRPAIGCFLSHLAIWRWVIAQNVTRVLVFEDDAAPAPRFEGQRFRDVVEAIPVQRGLVFLGRIIMGGLADQPAGSALARLYYFNGTFAYLITPAACRSLLPHLVPARYHIDHQISRALVENREDVAAYYTEPHCFEPDWSLRSDIYIPMDDETEANRELGQLIEATRHTLLEEGRPLLGLMR